jgi:hypothetical protein
MKVAEVTTSKAFRSYKEAREEVPAEQSTVQPVEEVKAAIPVPEEAKPEVQEPGLYDAYWN